MHWSYRRHLEKEPTMTRHVLTLLVALGLFALAAGPAAPTPPPDTDRTATIVVNPPPDTDRHADGSVTLIVQPPLDSDREADVVVANSDVGRVDVGITVYSPPPDSD